MSFIPPSPDARHRGFTLIEILVVISIIVLIAGLVIGGGAVLRKQSKISQAKATLAAAAGVETEIRATRLGKPVLHTDAPSSYGDHKEIEYFVVVATNTSDTSSKMIQALSPIDTDNDNRDEIVDTWKNPIIYRSKNPINSSASPDARFPRYGYPFFASAGPDGQWGTFNSDNEPDDEAKDNLHSFEVD